MVDLVCSCNVWALKALGVAPNLLLIGPSGMAEHTIYGVYGAGKTLPVVYLPKALNFVAAHLLTLLNALGHCFRLLQFSKKIG